MRGVWRTQAGPELRRVRRRMLHRVCRACFSMLRGRRQRDVKEHAGGSAQSNELSPGRDRDTGRAEPSRIVFDPRRSTTTSCCRSAPRSPDPAGRSARAGQRHAVSLRDLSDRRRTGESRLGYIVSLRQPTSSRRDHPNGHRARANPTPFYKAGSLSSGLYSQQSEPTLYRDQRRPKSTELKNLFDSIRRNRFWFQTIKTGGGDGSVRFALQAIRKACDSSLPGSGSSAPKPGSFRIHSKFTFAQSAGPDIRPPLMPAAHALYDDVQSSHFPPLTLPSLNQDTCADYTSCRFVHSQWLLRSHYRPSRAPAWRPLKDPI